MRPSKVENPVRRCWARRPTLRNGARVNVVGSQSAARALGCCELAQSGLSLACTSACQNERALALGQLPLQPPKGGIPGEGKVPHGRVDLALISWCRAD